jgi:hypothetical protein
MRQYWTMSKEWSARSELDEANVKSEVVLRPKGK